MSRVLVGALALFAANCLATRPAAAETVAIVNARIETVAAAGEISSGVLVIEGGRIAAVGASVSVPAGARVIDAHGGVVTPGLIAPSTNLGVAELEQVASTRDDRAGGSVSAGFDVQYGINPASTLIPLARLGGVTRAAVTPIHGGGGGTDEEEADASSLTSGGGEGQDPGLFDGQAALIRLGVQDAALPVTRAKAAMALDDARDYARNRAGFDHGQARPYRLSRIDLEALVPVVEGRTPLLVRVHRAADIRQVLALAAEQKLKLILEGVEEGWLVAPEIARAGTPVIVDPEAALPDQFESLGSRLDNAARLQASGVLVAIEGSREFYNLRQQRFNAGTAVANGLPYQAALAAITANPARIWGLGDRVGTLESGKDADLVIWNGDPLETTSFPTAVFIAGQAQPMTSRETELRDRYLNPDRTYPPSYR